MAEIDKRTFGGRLAYARLKRSKLKKLTQTALATKIGIKQGSLSALENNITKEVSGPVLIALARALDFRADWLMTGEGAEEENLKPDELALVQKYREATPTWRTSLQGLAALTPEQQNWLMESVLPKVFQPAVSDERVSQYISPAPRVVKPPTGEPAVPVRLAHGSHAKTPSKARHKP